LGIDRGNFNKLPLFWQAYTDGGIVVGGSDDMTVGGVDESSSVDGAVGAITAGGDVSAGIVEAGSDGVAAVTVGLIGVVGGVAGSGTPPLGARVSLLYSLCIIAMPTMLSNSISMRVSTAVILPLLTFSTPRAYFQIQ